MEASPSEPEGPTVMLTEGQRAEPPVARTEQLVLGRARHRLPVVHLRRVQGQQQAVRQVRRHQGGAFPTPAQRREGDRSQPGAVENGLSGIRGRHQRTIWMCDRDP